MGSYKPTIGLEVHCQLKTRTKLFCGCATEFGALANHHTCPVCLGYPGALPVVNGNAIEAAIQFALATQAKINPRSIFARKQYFYPDLPKGYQISQYEEPFCEFGRIALSSGKVVDIVRAHLEEDAGKSSHASDASYIDLNRAGIPLLEIVSSPCIHSSDEVLEYLKRLRAIVRYLDICDANLEEGSFRCDVNISISPDKSEKLGTRCEIKNLNSFRNIEKAIQYELIRQSDLLDMGQPVKQQTLLYDPAQEKTRPMRSKEDVHDYRYFPDPDLPPLVIVPERIEKARAKLPELADRKHARYTKEFGISANDADIITLDKDLAEFFENTLNIIDPGVAPKSVANWLLSEFLREANKLDWPKARPKITAEHLAKLLNLLHRQVISGKIAKTVFNEIIETGMDPEAIVKEKGLLQISDESEIEKLIEQVLDANLEQVDQFLAGKEKVFGFFVGTIMKLAQGKLNPGILNERLREKLNARRPK